MKTFQFKGYSVLLALCLGGGMGAYAANAPAPHTPSGTQAKQGMPSFSKLYQEFERDLKGKPETRLKRTLWIGKKIPQLIKDGKLDPKNAVKLTDQFSRYAELPKTPEQPKPPIYVPIEVPETDPSQPPTKMPPPVPSGDGPPPPFPTDLPRDPSRFLDDPLSPPPEGDTATPPLPPRNGPPPPPAVPTPPPPPPGGPISQPTPPAQPGGNLADQLQQGQQNLKKVGPKDEPQKPVPSTGNALGDILTKAMKERRKDLEESSESQRSLDDSGSEWGD